MNRFIIITIILFATCNPIYAQRTKEPLNFRGIEWDTYYSAIPGMTKQYSRNEKIDVFKKSGDEMSIGTCKLDTLIYEGFSGRIYKVNMTFSTCDPSSVFNMFKNKYGECTSVEDSLEHYICTWDWKRINLIFSIDTDSSASEISYTYKITEKEYQTYLKDKGGVKKDKF